MHVLAKVSQPDDIEVSMTITLSLGQWKRLREDLEKGSSYVGTDLSREIRIVVMNAEQTFYATEGQRQALTT